MYFSCCLACLCYSKLDRYDDEDDDDDDDGHVLLFLHIHRHTGTWHINLSSIFKIEASKRVCLCVVQDVSCSSLAVLLESYEDV